MDDVIPTLDDLRSIFNDPTIGDKTETIPEVVTVPEIAAVIPQTDSPFQNPVNDISQEVKTITPELTDEEVAQRLADAENSPEVVKSGENDTVSPQVDVIAPAIPEIATVETIPTVSTDNQQNPEESIKTLETLRQPDGTLKGGIPQETNKNGTAGRPTVMTEQTLEKLREAFLFGCTDREACIFAEIAPQTLYDYQKEHPEYVDQKEHFKDNPKMKARKNIFDALMKGDSEISQWYLEHKASKEFSKRTQMTGGDGENQAPIKIEYVVPKSDK